MPGGGVTGDRRGLETPPPPCRGKGQGDGGHIDAVPEQTHHLSWVPRAGRKASQPGPLCAHGLHAHDPCGELWAFFVEKVEASGSDRRNPASQQPLVAKGVAGGRKQMLLAQSTSTQNSAAGQSKSSAYGPTGYWRLNWNPIRRPFRMLQRTFSEIDIPLLSFLTRSVFFGLWFRVPLLISTSQWCRPVYLHPPTPSPCRAGEGEHYSENELPKPRRRRGRESGAP